MSVGVPTVVDPGVLLALGIALLTVGVAVGLATATAARTRSPRAGVLVGTGAVGAIYVAVTQGGVPIEALSLLALVVSALTVAVAALSTVVRLSRAPL